MLLELTTSTLKALSGNCTAISTGQHWDSPEMTDELNSALSNGLQWEHWQREGLQHTHSWPLTFLTEISCLEDVHDYSTLFNVDRNISACLYVGVTHKHSQPAGDKDWS